MLNIISDFVKTLLPAKRKQTPSGWISFNAPCCVHNGNTADTRGRGGLTANADGSVSYHCFNCNFKASYQPGRHLTFKFRKLLSWMGAADNDVKRLVIEAIRIKDLVAPEQVKEPEEKIEFKVRELPKDAVSFQQLLTFHLLDDLRNVPPLLNSAVDYVKARNIDTDKYDFLWTDSTDHSLHQRVIIPMIWEGKTIGYTARAFTDGVKPKYYSHYEPNLVFNTNNQQREWKFVIVCEGPFDAMAIDGVSVQSNDISDQQVEIIESLGKEVIYVPDFDKHLNKRGQEVWPGLHAVEQAIELGWSVSFPVWHEDAKDAAKAVELYGKLFTLKAILDGKESNPLRIKLMAQKI